MSSPGGVCGGTVTVMRTSTRATIFSAASRSGRTERGSIASKPRGMRVADGRLPSPGAAGRTAVTASRARSTVTTTGAPLGNAPHAQSGASRTVSPPVKVKRPGAIVSTFPRYAVGTAVVIGLGVALGGAAV